MKDFEDKLILAVDCVAAIDGGAEGTGQLKQENCHDTVNDFQAVLSRFWSLLSLFILFHQISLVVLEKEESHKVDVVGQLFYFDYIRERHLSFLRDSELLTCVDVRLLILLMYFALTQIVVLDEGLPCRKNVSTYSLACLILSLLNAAMVLLSTAVAL